MDHIILFCGKWKFERKKMILFEVDNDQGSKLLAANEETRYEDFVKTIYEDYEVDFAEHKLELMYVLPKPKLVKENLDTPPVKVRNDRQLHGFLCLHKVENVRLCVEFKLKKKKVEEASKEPEEFLQKDDLLSAEYEDSDEDNDRFDYCDDSDVATSDDENFTSYGFPPDQVQESQGSPTKMSSATVLKTPKGDCTHNRFDLSSFKLEVGQSFDSKDALATRLKICSVVHKFNFDVDKSTRTLWFVKCWVKGCTWKLRATPVGESSRFTIRIYVDEHSCSVTERSSRSRQATPEILSLLYKDYIGGVDRTILPRHVESAMNMSFGIKQMDYWKSHRTLIVARDLVMGSSENGYEELPSYLHKIRMANPGTLARLEVDANNRFKYLFLTFSASITGFPFMRKVVVVDGIFLQGKYKGTLLIATSQDANFQIFPIAFAVVDTKNDESWTWFFRQLSRVIPDDEGLALISERHKSIRKAISVVYPLGSTGIFTYHLYKNILLRYRERDLFGLVKKAAYSFRLADFEASFETIKGLNPYLHAYLERADVCKWARAHFRGDRYNILTSNIAESINRALSDVRRLPIVRLLESIRLMMTRWFATRKHDADLMKTSLTRGVEKLLEVIYV
uniref:Transposon MuDR-like protein n=1 Tax=Brassica oleracea var. alboglabra TaxID=3714 RepID=B4YPW1_BRAOA|nr:maize transposon MuDR-like protein [Brassica oleracea var. alboglabra]